MQPQWRSFSPARVVLLFAAIWAVAVVASQTSLDAQQRPEGVVLPAARPSRARPFPSPPPGVQQRPLSPAVSGAELVGEETCLACHEAQKKGYGGTLHGRADHPRSPAAKQGCESCHGPGSKHLEDPTVPGTIQAFSTAAARNANDACLTCHARGAHAMWEGSMHEARGLACVSCHSVHAFQSEVAQLKSAREVDTCAACHRDKAARVDRSGHMPLREGKMECSTCHNPHGTTNVRQLRRGESIGDLCTTCHADKRGPYLWEHAPTRDGCTTCHDPHGSANERMLITKTPILCQRCHVMTRHPSAIYDAGLIGSGATPSVRIFARSCITCHSTIHGSNHPSGQRFIR